MSEQLRQPEWGTKDGLVVLRLTPPKWDHAGTIKCEVTPMGIISRAALRDARLHSNTSNQYKFLMMYLKDIVSFGCIISKQAMEKCNIRTKSIFMPCSIIQASSLSADCKKLERVRKGCSEEQIHVLHFNISDSCSMHYFGAYPINHSSDVAAGPLEAGSLFSYLNLCRSAVKILWLFFLHNVHVDPLKRSAISLFFSSKPYCYLKYSQRRKDPSLASRASS